MSVRGDATLEDLHDIKNTCSEYYGAHKCCDGCPFYSKAYGCDYGNEGEPLLWTLPETIEQA